VPRSDYLLLILFDSSCQLPCCPCHLWRHSRLPSYPCCLVVAFVAVAVASPLPRRRLTPPFHPPSLSSRPPSQPHEDSDGDSDCHWHRRSLSLPVLLPPPTSFFPPPSPLPPLPLSGCVHRGGHSGGAATPAVIRDGPDGWTTKTRYGTASAAAPAAAEATEEEDCDGCNSADPQRRLDDSLLRLADGILLRSIVATTAWWRRSPATTTTSMPAIDIGALFIGREDWEGNDGSGVAKEDDDDTDTEAGGGARARAISWRSSSANFEKGVLGGGGQQQRQWRQAGTTSTKMTL
jgi:hypothetical protein